MASDHTWRLLHHIQGKLWREWAGSVKMLLRYVDVSSDEDLVVDAWLEFVVDEAFVVLAVSQDEGVGDGPLEELGGNVGVPPLIADRLAVGRQVSCVELHRGIGVGLVGVWDNDSEMI